MYAISAGALIYFLKPITSAIFYPEIVYLLDLRGTNRHSCIRRTTFLGPNLVVILTLVFWLYFNICMESSLNLRVLPCKVRAIKRRSSLIRVTCKRPSVAAPYVQEVFRFLRPRSLHSAKAVRDCPINRAFACNALASAGLGDKSEIDCESYGFGQAFLAHRKMKIRAERK